jgi:quinol monooxygenase YgiN
VSAVPTLPWTSGPTTVDSGETVVMASRFRVRRLRHVLPFFLDALKVHRQVRAADGAIGVSLEAHPLRREFRTLSQWRDRAAVDAMVRTEPHRSVMPRHRAAMEDAAFEFWTVPAGTTPTWSDADSHL